MATIAENIQTLKSIKSDIKNAIIQKGGSVTDAFGTYAQAITNLPSGGGGGGTEIEDALIMRTISGTYYNDRISMVGNYAFIHCQISSINLANCLEIGVSAFYYCSALSFVNLPLCSSIKNYAFAHCTKLESIDLPNLEYIGSSAFDYCSALSFVNLPKCKSVYNHGLADCQGLISINLPLCINLESYALAFCRNLSYVSLPLCQYIGSNVFNADRNLFTIYLNSVTSVTNMPYSNTFSNCPNLTSVYVPASLVDTFKVASNWSSISDKIVAYTEAQVSTEDML